MNVNGRWWERERESRVPGGKKGNPNFKKQLQAGNRWLEPGFHGNGELLVIYPV